MDPETKTCPICTKPLPVSAFGICRARRDGLNLYCKVCINAKVTAGRKALKEYRELRKRYQIQAIEQIDEVFPSKPIALLSPAAKVKLAIANGHNTYSAIRYETKLTADALGDVLANLILWKEEVRSRVVNGTRLYFLNQVEEKPPINFPVAEPWRDVARKANRIEIKGERRKVA